MGDLDGPDLLQLHGTFAVSHRRLRSMQLHSCKFSSLPPIGAFACLGAGVGDVSLRMSQAVCLAR